MRSASTTSTTTASTPAKPSSYRVVALGDSVPSGFNCNCTGYVSLYAAAVHKDTGVTTTTDNQAVPGAVSSDVLAQLQGDSAVARSVARADFVLIQIGANDFVPDRALYDSGDCGGSDNLGCFEPQLPQLSANLAAILERVAYLDRGHPVAVRVLDYWNVFEDGDIGRANGQAYVRDSARLTALVNDRICAAAQAAAAVCVRTTAAFERDNDVTSLLAGDGDHPNAEGHQLLARLVQAAGYAPVA